MGKGKNMKRETFQTTVFGRELRKFRIRNHMTQKALGDRIGASSNTIHLWETRVTKPNVAYLIRLAGIMDEPLADLIEQSLLVWDEDACAGSSLHGGIS